MYKIAELTNPDSCLNRAHDDEMVFVLLGRDVAAPHAIRLWAEERIMCNKNERGDAQISEAWEAARTMESYRLAMDAGALDADPGQNITNVAKLMAEPEVQRKLIVRLDVLGEILSSNYAARVESKLKEPAVFDASNFKQPEPEISDKARMDFLIEEDASNHLYILCWKYREACEDSINEQGIRATIDAAIRQKEKMK